MTHDYEAVQIHVFGEMAKKGYIYKGKKAVYWCPHCETALAEAEIEYGEEKSPAIFVKCRSSKTTACCQKQLRQTGLYRYLDHYSVDHACQRSDRAASGL